MNVILVDDEPAMHLILTKMLGKLPGIRVRGAFADTASATAFLSENADIGLAFVDISMKGENGLAFAARMERAGYPLHIVFVTSHKDYALDAFELSALDYLVKPVSQERLQRTVNRVLTVPGDPRLQPTEAADTAANRFEILALGDVAASNGPVRVKWISRKCTELFAYLLLHHGRRIPRSRLIADIFGGMDQANAESYLNTTAYQLRKSLEPLGMRDAVRSENDGYALELKHAAIDYVDFARQAEQLQVIDAGNVDAALRIERLYAGDLFGDKAYVWAASSTERYARIYESFSLKLAAALMAMRDSSAASKLLHKLNERNPLEESVVLLLMKLRAQARDKKGLAVLYADYVRLLGRELGIRPSEELKRLYDELASGMMRES
ncbi:response regulator [Paenibacillus glycinis]|uniref:Response regulator n=1 Tax=Paenibacillus glycinis TaxID=2697035 RepID=A0ABW9XTJ8_9BACL|nr:response regulator [Paenibacillus glycinis]NBD25664.1 response regulator [Paenibacillus glycinis]